MSSTDHVERKPSVLFVDDEPAMVRSIKRVMQREHYISRFALSAREAMDVIANQDVDVVVSDLKMPGMDGLTFLREVKRRYPDVVRIVLTSYSQITQVLATVNRGEVFRFLTKPVEDAEEFRQTIRTAIEHAGETHRQRHVAGCVTAVADRIAEIGAALKTIGNDGAAERQRLLEEIDEKSKQLKALFSRRPAECPSQSGITARKTGGGFSESSTRNAMR